LAAGNFNKQGGEFSALPLSFRKGKKMKEENVNGFFPKSIEWDGIIGFLDTLPGTGKEIDRNKKKERYSPFQIGIFIALILSLLTLFIPRISAAQEPIPKMNRPNFRIRGPESCLESLSPSLTENQKKVLENLRQAYMAEARPTRTELFALRLQLRYLLSDTNVQPRILFDQQRKISDLQAKLEELSLSYQVKAREVFTREQLQRLPQGWAFEIGLGHEIPIMDRSGRSWKGLR
jgi:Spy/CpxP family protein refolding chaperone